MAQQSTKKDDYEQMSVQDVVERFETDAEQGLSPQEAKRRLKEHGPNRIEQEQTNALVKFLSYFWGPIPWMIEGALVLSAVAGRWEDFGVIFAMLAINGGVSFWHESKTQKAIESLKKRLAVEARVIRGGKQQKIDGEELVPGDVVVVRIGDVIPADVMLLPEEQLSADESSLTGESLPVEKGEGDLVYSGTIAKRGEARGVVVATAGDTKFARTVELVATAQESSHFRRAVLKIGYFLMGSCGAMVTVILVVAIGFRHDPTWEVILFVLGLTLASIPAALPAVLSVTMTVGASRLAKMQAVVSRLASMEEMAGLDVQFVDKTGTLTQNELELQDPVFIDGDDKAKVILTAALTTQRQEPDPIDTAILKAVEDADRLDDYEISDFRPFDPTRKRAEATVKHEDETFEVAKGAPQAILELVEGGREQREAVLQKVDELGQRGLRALGVARKDEGRWSYLGILPLLDPPRDETADVIAGAKEHGIDIRMVTGDHEAIAREIARQVGLGQNIKAADAVFDKDSGETKLSDEDVLKLDGFAEVTPEHKFNIVKMFQSKDHIVGMTGDGVNDAPALKQADVGIAVSGATDAARSAADLVLVERGLQVISRAIEEARRIFERMTSYAAYRITETVRLLLFISISVLAFNYYPVTPLMIVLLAVLNDIPIMMIASDNARTSPQPVRWNMPRVLILASVLGGVGVISSILFFWYLRSWAGYPKDVVRTMMFLKLLVAGHLTLYITRQTGYFWQRPWPSLQLFLALEATQVGGTLIAVYGFLMTPVGWARAGMAWGYAAAWFVILDLLKKLTYRFSGTIHGSREKKSQKKARRDSR